MKRTLLTLASGVLLTVPATAQFHAYDGNFLGGVYVGSGDIDADGRGDIILIDKDTGHLVAGYGQSDGGLAWEAPRAIPSLPVAYSPLTRNELHVTVADLDRDGADDVAISVYHGNRALVFTGSSNRSRALAGPDEYFPGPGPAGIAAAQLDPSSPELELVMPVIALAQPQTISVRPRAGAEVTVSYGPIDPQVAAGLTGFALLEPAPPGSPAGRPVSATQGTFTLTFNGQTTHRLQVSSLNGNLQLATLTVSEPYREVIAANMRGSRAPGQFVLWGSGLNSLAMATVSQNQGAVAIEPLVVQLEKIEHVANIGGPGGLDRIAAVHEDRTRVTVYAWDTNRRRIEPVQSLLAPKGRTFGPIGSLAGANGGLFALTSDGGYLKYSYDAAGRLVSTHQGAAPQLPAFGGHATVMLYTADPLSGDAFEFESFAAGQWATGAAFAGGQIHAMREVFQNASGGLGQPLAVQLTPSANPGAGAMAQANQFGDASSSLFYAGGVSADGNAGVEISPPPGVYPLPVHVRFTPAKANTTIMYRVNGQPWQQATAAGYFAASDALVEYYGQSAAGALSTIKSAAYHVEPVIAGGTNPELQPADRDGDGMDDAFEQFYFNGLGQGFWDDRDNDGFSDGEEYQAQADPADATDAPPGVPSTPLTLWKKAQFGGNWNNPAFAADEADPDLDGMSNTLEYLTGGDPENPSDARQPRAAPGADGRLGLAFQRMPRTDIVVDVESSETLTGPWQVLARSSGGETMAAMVDGVTVVETESGSARQVSVTDAAALTDPATTRKFLRVTVRTE